MEPPPPRPSVPSATDDWWWIFDPRYSLRARASLIFGGGAIVFTVLLSWISGTILRQHLERQLGASFETLAYQVSDKIDRAIYERYRELQFTASLAPFRTAAVPAAERRQVLETLQGASPEFAWLGLTDAGGRIVAATHGMQEGGSAADRPWFRGARERPYAGNLHEMPELARTAPGTDGEPPRYLDLAVPVTSNIGQFLGVLGAHVGWTWARDVQLSVVPETARREHLGVTLYSPAKDVLLDSGGSGWSQPPDAPPIPDARRFRGMLVETAAGGTTYVTGYVRSRGFKEYRGLGWLVTVRQPAELAFAPVQELRRAIARWGFVFVCAFGVTSWLFAGRIARNLHRVTAASERIRTGDILSVMPRPRNESEYARMCTALGDMVDDLRRQQESLTAENKALKARESAAGSPPEAQPPSRKRPAGFNPW